jgi:hypothetical protein
MNSHIVSYGAVVIVLLYGIYNALASKHTSGHRAAAPESSLANTQPPKARHEVSSVKRELQQARQTTYRQKYITDVINHGSSQLHFKPQEVMEGGFASPEDAPKIACYVISLAGESCREGYPEEAAMFYSSNCGGCHGEDGKGLNGTYPNLTQRPLLGIQKRIRRLKELLQTQKAL